MLSRISDRLLGLIPNFSNITHILCAGRGMRIFILKGKGEEEVFAALRRNYHGYAQTSGSKPFPYLPSTEGEGNQADARKPLPWHCLGPGDELGPPHGIQAGSHSAGRGMLSPKEDALHTNIPAAWAASPPRRESPSALLSQAKLPQSSLKPGTTTCPFPKHNASPSPSKRGDHLMQRWHHSFLVTVP